MANVIITGANRGIGLEMVKQLSEHPPLKPLHILACARRPPSSTDFKPSPDTKVDWHKLDIGDAESISSFATTVNEQCPEGVDVMINNAGVNFDPTEGHGEKQAKKTILVNYDGTMAMTKALLPLMRRPGLEALGTSRIVNVSSVGSKLSGWTKDQEMHRKFKQASTLDQVQSLRDDFLSAVETGAEEENGWPKRKNYSVSKSLINSGTQVLAAENMDIHINCCCPGWVNTDMGSLIGKPSKTLEEGTRVPLNLAFGPISETGKYFENPSVADTGRGQVSDWS